MKEITREEYEVLLCAQKHGLRLPNCYTSENRRFFRPDEYTPMQEEEYAQLLKLYLQTQQLRQLRAIRRWTALLGILAIIGMAGAVLIVLLLGGLI